ncbi:MAG: nicotinate (nicotinamide) nucleotide adenylyltransferase [Ignavibacteriales bacterium]|nr:nicotinate (nicotinamide) nucleotide adenylyltransferase [Ignavibacteriales bacterium]
MKHKKNIGILGGTFDPPHVGHLIIAESVLETATLDVIIFVPAFQAPHKRRTPGATTSQRLAMTRLAIRGNKRFACLEIELRRKGTSYTVDTLETLTLTYPGSDFSLIMGADSFLEFSSWKSPERILELARIIVYPRPGMAIAPDLPFRKHAEVISAPILEVSSSLIRRRLASGKSVRYLVPDTVLRYLHRNKLYLP